MKTSRKVIIAYLTMTLLSSLSACGDLNIDAEYNEGNKSTSDNLYAGTCGTWDIAGEYKDGEQVNGRCELVLPCGGSFEFNQSDWQDGDFFSQTKKLYGQWTFKAGSSCGIETLDPYDMCEVRDYDSYVQFKCYNGTAILTR